MPLGAEERFEQKLSYSSIQTETVYLQVDIRCQRILRYFRAVSTL